MVIAEDEKLFSPIVVLIQRKKNVELWIHDKHSINYQVRLLEMVRLV